MGKIEGITDDNNDNTTDFLSSSFITPQQPQRKSSKTTNSRRSTGNPLSAQRKLASIAQIQDAQPLSRKLPSTMTSVLVQNVKKEHLPYRVLAHPGVDCPLDEKFQERCYHCRAMVELKLWLQSYNMPVSSEGPSLKLLVMYFPQLTCQQTIKTRKGILLCMRYNLEDMQLPIVLMQGQQRAVISWTKSFKVSANTKIKDVTTKTSHNSGGASREACDVNFAWM
ncbi:hypothetical protein TSTA_063600 [Talaromyces stipitatus ATCC 10500]|uniref:Uncharacterized protein n=1 Tax=Talaromyces stipitatus (strain ATCC 10500 / CBS 375.48 / QM 6759 / NRRL 1006) TaxID=441959 RepID=B8LYF2_TALSN|nr:uncharacterized protein TSTA_063600 [Talaromyces stipitatus ATCC 10500]EED22881.1 hypothetical protein TSTA_063600 [Talaromyces stipitatus ATCC 10500]